MGFNKKYVSIQTIKNLIDGGQNLKEYFIKADALIFTDSITIEIYNLVMSNKSFQHLIK